MKTEDIPEHITQNISTGEEVLATSMSNIKFGSKAYSKVLCILTTEKLMADTKKILIKLFLTNILTIENKKGKIKIYTSSRSGKEEVVLFEPLKQPKEKKGEYLERITEICNILEGSFSNIPGRSSEPEVMLESNSNRSSNGKEPPKIFCPNCGSKLPDGGTFCAECGTRVI